MHKQHALRLGVYQKHVLRLGVYQMHALRLVINSLRAAQPPSRGFIGVAQTFCAKTAAFVLNMLS
jgi:hypothetical protein